MRALLLVHRHALTNYTPTDCFLRPILSPKHGGVGKGEDGGDGSRNANDAAYSSIIGGGGDVTYSSMRELHEATLSASPRKYSTLEGALLR